MIGNKVNGNRQFYTLSLSFISFLSSHFTKRNYSPIGLEFHYIGILIFNGGKIEYKQELEPFYF